MTFTSKKFFFKFFTRVNPTGKFKTPPFILLSGDAYGQNWMAVPSSSLVNKQTNIRR